MYVAKNMGDGYDDVVAAALAAVTADGGDRSDDGSDRASFRC